MPRKLRAVNGALLGVAATAVALKQALFGPLAAVASPQLERLHNTLGEKPGAVVGQSQELRQQAEARLVGAVIRNPVTPPRGQNPEPAAITGLRPQPDQSPDQAQLRRILRDAAIRHGIDPKLVLAVSYWESGWDQSLVSSTGAVGLMQVEPATAQEAGPALLGRAVDVTEPHDNADVGTAILKQDLDAFQNPAMALAAYYQGATSLRAYGMFPDTQQYVDGILNLASRM